MPEWVRKAYVSGLRSGMTPEEIQPQIQETAKLMKDQGLEEPWIDPATAGAAGFVGGAKAAAMKGAGKLGKLARGLIGGGLAAGTDYPIGMATEALGEKYPNLAFPFALALGLASGAGLEAPLESAAVKAFRKLSKLPKFKKLPKAKQFEVSQQVMDSMRRIGMDDVKDIFMAGKRTIDDEAAYLDDLIKRETAKWDQEGAAGAVKEDPFAAAQDTGQRAAVKEQELETYEQGVGRIRQLGGLSYDNVRREFGQEGVQELRGRFGLSFVRKGGEPLDTAAQILSEESPGLGIESGDIDSLWRFLTERAKSKKQIRADAGAETFPGLPPQVRKEGPVRQPENVGPRLEGARRRDVIDLLNKSFDIPAVKGRMTLKKAAGTYHKREQMIRVKKRQDLEARLHEYGHYFDDLLDLPAKKPPEVQRLAYEGAKDKDREGFAEFVRLFALHPEDAQKAAPDYFRQFEETLAQHPEVQDVILKVRSAHQTLQSAPSVQKVMGHIFRGSETESKGLPTLNDIYTAVKDHFHPIKRAKQLAEQQGAEFRPSRDPYLLARATKGWIRKAEQFLRHGTFQIGRAGGFQKTGPAFREIMGPIEAQGLTNQLDAYLVAKRALHDDRILQGFEGVLSRSDFEQTVAELEPKFQETAEQLYKYQDELLDYVVSTGRISGALADKIRQDNLFYAPLYRVIGEGNHLRSKGLGTKNIDQLMSPVKKLKGSELDVYSPTENILYNTYAMINIAERQRVANALRHLAQQPGMGRVMFKVPPRTRVEKVREMEGVRQLMQTLDEIGEESSIRFADALGMLEEHQNAVKEILRKFRDKKWMDEHGEEGLQALMEEKGLTNRDLWELDGFVKSFYPDWKPRENEILLYRDGKPELYEVHDKEFLKAVKSIDAADINALTKVLAMPARMLRAGATTFSPEFAIRNPMRDQLIAGIQSNYGFVPGFDLFRGMFHILGQTDTWQKFNASGAAHAALVSMDRRYISKNVKELMQTPGLKDVAKNPGEVWRWVVDHVTHPLRAVQNLSEMTEEASRVAEFSRAMKKEGGLREGKGWDQQDVLFQAGYAGREVTLDFSRQGNEVAKQLNLLSAFWNARMEGLDKMVRTFKDHPMRSTTKAFLGITLPSMVNWYYHKDDPYYQELPPWRRNLFWNIVMHNDDGSLKRIISIPKPFELGVIFGSIPEAALEWAYRNDQDFAREVGKNIRDTLNLVPVPTAAIPVVEHIANKSLFFQRPIVPRHLREGASAVEATEQFRPTTSEVAKFASKAISKLPGTEGVSPAILENYVHGYTAALGRMGLETGDMLIEKLGVTDLPPEPSYGMSEIPGLRAFFSRFPTANSKSLEQFYREYNRLEKVFNTQKKKAGLRGWGVEVPPGEKLANFRTAAKALNLQRKLIDITYKDRDLKPKQKRELLNYYYMGLINTARAALKKPQIKRKEPPAIQRMQP
jgi:hypothetical protein